MSEPTENHNELNRQPDEFSLENGINVGSRDFFNGLVKELKGLDKTTVVRQYESHKGTLERLMNLSLIDNNSQIGRLAIIQAAYEKYFREIGEPDLCDSVNIPKKCIALFPDKIKEILQEQNQTGEPTPDAKPETDKKTTANNKNPIKRISIPKLLDSLKDDPNKELTPDDIARLNDRKSSSQISNWLKKNYDKKLLRAFDRMTDQNHNTKQTYSTAIESVFKTINPFLSEIIDRSLKNKLKRSRLCVEKDGFVRDIKGK